MYNRRVLAGEFAVINKYLFKDLIDLGIWNPALRNQIIAERGSVQGIQGIPAGLKELYKTVWEIKQKAVIDQAADRCGHGHRNYYYYYYYYLLYSTIRHANGNHLFISPQ